ncbi:LamG-like jellyroll fold domain-containing protein [Oerskovia enterophila]|uniref:Laminin G domain protein n=1 Tax=Oerskovia enterophila TaxID=43678 RepID=A0ABX2Y7V3_9CELL|nr:LamG-like jellyroll fold domain-containing protein [Oerskovia enterophila]OCI32672.1 laminin G domain protein [Oerskovia enterophila]
MARSDGSHRRPATARRSVVRITAPLLVGALVLATAGSVVSGDLRAASAAGPGNVPVTTVQGDTRAEGREIGGLVGQDVASNFSADGAGPETPTTVATSLWWRWTAPESGRISFSTSGSELDTTVAVRRAAAPTTVVASNDDDGDVATSQVAFDAVAGEEYLVEVGTKAGEPGLVTLAWQTPAPAADAAPNGPSALTAETALTTTAVPLSGNTGEKPQSKLWFAHDTWWAALASTSTSPAGTWVWRYDLTAGTWTNVVRISDRTDVRADVKVVGDVAHVLLHGPTTSLVSLEYVASSNAYQPWSQRTTATTVSLPGSETGTIDVDSTGRLWLVADTSTSIQARYSDAPYTTFSAPVTVASGVLDDDIGMVTALPGGKIGVLWSNQNTKRFGFRTHVDGTNPQTWTADEKPAQSSALNLGDGMADDHMNVAVASDGTLYAAVKTSYDSPGSTVIALLVRRAGGTWDPLYEVDRLGTRPIVEIDEATGLLRVVYTHSEVLDDILEKVTPLDAISFSQNATTVLDGTYNNVTGAKQNVPGATLVMAASSSTAGTARLPWIDPRGPVATAGLTATSVGVAVTGTLKGASPVGGALTFEVVAAPASGTVVVTNPATGAFTYTPATGYVGTTTFTFRVKAGSTWSNVATQTVRVTSAPGVRGTWELDEGSGTTSADSSGWAQTGTLSGGATWVDGTDGKAVRLDGNAGKVSVPDSEALDVSSALTVSAWVRPERQATQYVVKKAVSGSSDGYELGISSAGKPFLRVNQKTSGDTFRVNATSVLPTNGSAWVHLAGTFDGQRLRIYVDGVEQGSIAGPASVGVNTLPLTIGAQPDGLYPFQGAVDSVRLSDRALTAAQITEIVQGGGPVPTTPVATDGASTTTAGAAVSGTLAGTSPSGGALTFEVVAAPASGTVVVTNPATGAFTYTPTAGFVGADAFSFRVKAGSTWSNVATQSVRVTAVAGTRGTWELDEGTGVVASDSSGWGYQGALSGGTSWVTGKSGKAVRLDGSTGRVSVADADGLDVSSALTVSAWVRPERQATQYVVKKAVSGSSDGYELGISSAGKPFLRVNQKTSGDTFRVNATSVLPTNGSAWVHLAGTFDGQRLRIYVDGVEQGSIAGPASVGVNTLPLTIGAQPDGLYPFQGAVDSVRLLDRALTAAEVASLHESVEQPALPPVAQDVSASTTAGAAVSGTLAGSSPSGGALTFEVVAAPASGTVVVTNPATGAFTYTPAAGYVGTTTFTFRVGANGLWSSVATARVQVTPADGLRGAWDLEEGTGLAAADTSGWGNVGALSGGTTWVTAGGRSAVRFDGATGKVSIPDADALDVSSALTVAAWVRPEQVATQYVVKKASPSATDGFELGLSSAGKAFLRLNQATSGDTYRVNATSTYPSNGTTWVHLVGTYDGQRMRLYVDGVEQGSAAGPGTVGVNTLPLLLGGQPGGTLPLKGAVDGVRLYDRALSAAEVVALRTQTPPPA